MSTPLTAINLTTAVVGTVGTVAWTRDDVQAGGSVGLGRGVAHIRLYNESGCGLLLRFASGGVGERIPAGAWPTLEIPAGCLSLSYTVEYVLTGAPVSLLLPIVYQPGETVPETPVLGNSPIGIGGTVNTSSVNEVINDGNAAPTHVLEATPSGAGSSQAIINNDGSATLGGGHVTIDNTGKIAGANIDASEIQTGTFPAGATVPAANIAAGSLGVGVAAAATALQAGALPAGVTIPSSQVTGSIPVTQQIDATHAASLTVPQIETATAGAGIGIDNATAGVVDIYPTCPAGVAETLRLYAQSPAGTLVEGPHLILDTKAYHLPGQLMDAHGNDYPVATTFLGTGSGTVSHFLGGGTAPRFVGITTTEVNSTETVGADSIGTTTVHVNSANAWPWVGVAILA